MVSLTSSHPPMQSNSLPRISIPTHTSSSTTVTSSSYTTPTALPQSLPNTNSPAVESAVAAYASRLLKTKSPPEACIDSSVGPYVTSILRSAGNLLNIDNLQYSLAEYDSLMELLEEHCSMSPDVAHTVLQSIAKAVKTGVLDDGFDEPLLKTLGGSLGSGGMDAFSHSMMGGRFRSKSLGAEHDLIYDATNSMDFLGKMLETTYVSGDSRRRSNSLILQPPFMEGVEEGDCDMTRDSYDDDVDQSFVLEEDPVPTKKESHSSDTTVDTSASGGNWHPSHSTMTPSYQDKGMFQGHTPLKPDRLIPVDLLGVIDDPSTPAGKESGLNPWSDVISNSINDFDSREVSKEYANPENAITTTTTTNTAPTTTAPTTSTTTSKQDEAKPTTTNQQEEVSKPTPSTTEPATEPAPSAPAAPVAGKGKKKSKTKATDLAATLFATSTRSRSNSILSDKSPKLKPMTAPPPSVLGMAGMSYSSSEAVMNNSIPALFNKQMKSAVEILMAMNFDLCEDAAYNAVLVSNADVNIAQHVIDGALAQPPVCRHMLNGGCYRSDCSFSHDVDGHTCLFWLRGRCGKGDSCRFMHGFHEKLLEGMQQPTRESTPEPSQQFSLGESATAASKAQSSVPIPIKTANLVQHNIKTSFSLGKEGASRSLSQSPKPFNGFLGNSAPQSEPSSFLQCQPIDKDSSPPIVTPSNALIPPRDSLIPPRVSPASPTEEVKQSSSTKPSTFSFASIASKGYNSGKSFNPTNQNTSNVAPSKPVQSVRIPQDLWNPNINRSPAAFHISDPMARYKEVSQYVQRQDVIDLHYQSVKTFAVVLRNVLPEKLREHGEAWIVTGSGHHVNRNSHQKSGGVLETAVHSWLTSNSYKFVKGRDKNGFGGALLVKR